MARRILFVVLACSVALVACWSSTQSVAAEEPPEEKLSLTIAPPILPADGSTQSVIYVQLLGADGIPRLVSEDTEVSLISSNPPVASVPDGVYISKGESYTIAPLTASSVPGKAVITGMIHGRPPATAEVETVSPLGATPPFRLVLYAAPQNMLPGGRPPGRLCVVLLGANGRLVTAAEGLEVVLSSSDPGVVRVAERITIPKGAHFVITDLEPLAVGRATLSAARSGFVSEFLQVQVVEPGERAEALILYLSPPLLTSGTQSHRGVVVQAVDADGKPVPFPSMEVHLASSSPSLVEVSPLAELARDVDTQYVMGTLNTGKITGTATITAVATGLRPAAANLEVQGQLPVQLKAYLAPEKLLGVEVTPGFIVIQVVDGNGVPVTWHGDIPIKLVGGYETLPDEAVIPERGSFLTLRLKGPQPTRQVELWLVSPGLTAAQLSLKVHALPTSVEVLTSEEPVFPGEKVDILVRVQSRGSPLPEASVAWTATNGTLSDTTPETDEEGEARAVFLAVAPGDSTVKVTVNKLGHDTAEGQAIVAVLAPTEPGKPSPRLFGIPILYLLLAIPLLLLGYLGYKFLPALKRRRSTDDTPPETDDMP